jgi:transposase
VWTDKNRAKYDRDHLRYPSDLTDDEWGYVEPLIPPAKRGGGKRRTDMRAVIRDPEHQRNERSRAATDLAYRQEYAVSCP